MIQSYKKVFQKNTSIYTAECFALTLALEFIANKPDSNYYILADSLSAIQSLNSTKLTTKINPYIIRAREKYSEIVKNHNSNIVWISSHSGIIGNERVDSFAKQAATLKPNPSTRTPYSDFREQFSRNAQIITKKDTEAQGLPKGNFFFQFYRTDKQKPWFHKINQDRKFITTFNRCRADHYNLAASLGRIGIIHNIRCDCGAPLQDLNHTIWQCPFFDQERIILYENLISLRKYPPYNICNFLATADIKALECIFNFLQKCDLNL